MAGQPDLAERFEAPLPERAVAAGTRLQPERHVRQDPLPGDQPGFLEDHRPALRRA